MDSVGNTECVLVMLASGRAEAGSNSFGSESLLSCRVEKPSAHVARVNTALSDKLCALLSAHSVAQNSQHADRIMCTVHVGL